MTASALRRDRRFFSRVLVATAGFAALTGCDAGRSVQHQHGDRLVVARASDATNLDPARASDIESLEVAEQVFGRL
ncbi:MAG: hypothetical protein ABIS92_12965, partial [Polyangia bacterium]